MKFELEFVKCFTLNIEIEAKSKEQALEIANEQLFNGNKTNKELLEESQEGYFENTYIEEVV